MKQVLEVIIKKRKLNYLATCNLFPSCKGIGKTREIALKNLGKSITDFMTSLIGSTLNNLFTSKNYTEVLFDQSKHKKKESIAFNLSSNDSGLPTSFLFQVPAMTTEREANISNMNSINDLDLPYELAGNYSEMSDLEDKKDSLIQLSNQGKVNNESDSSYVFGFPINFN